MAIPDPEQLFIVHVDSVVYNFSIAVETSGEYSERDLYFLRPIGKIQSNWGDYLWLMMMTTDAGTMGVPAQ